MNFYINPSCKQTSNKDMKYKKNKKQTTENKNFKTALRIFWGYDEQKVVKNMGIVECDDIRILV